ncbi:hypothetical protein CHL67_05960 [Prosthecochloris sp. GSB1]|nr:hypothetical protein CHL67_05960 [Prosthecochloris sp. GSB1]
MLIHMSSSKNMAGLFFLSLVTSAFFLNFAWESFHGLLFQNHPVMPASRYVPMMVEMSLYDASGIVAFYLVVSACLRILLWPTIPANVMIYLAVALLGAAAIEFVAVHVLHEWAYLPSMPAVFGIGVLPLVQLPLTGLASIVLARRFSSLP